jgi:phosphoheptose isomerase
MKNSTKKIFEELFSDYAVLRGVEDNIISACDMLIECYQNGKKTLICGNGGSASDCEHIVGEFMKGFKLKRPLVPPVPGLPDLQAALRSISLVSQTSLVTAVANDIGAQYIFAQQVLGYGDTGDVLIALSTSGNAENVCRAVLAARAQKCKTIAITGSAGGKLADMCDCAIRLPANETYKVQELTLPVYHALCAGVENEFFGDTY